MDDQKSLIHICVLLKNYTNISSLTALKKGETHPYTNTNIKPLSNQQGIYCVAVMQAQWVWTLAMCSVQHKRDNLRSWPRSKQTVAAALKSVTLLLLLSQMTQATGEPSTVSSSQWTSQPELLASALNQLLDRKQEGEQDRETTLSGKTLWIMCSSIWADEPELKPIWEKKKKKKRTRGKGLWGKIMGSKRTKKERCDAQVSRKLYGGGEWKKP